MRHPSPDPWAIAWLLVLLGLLAILIRLKQRLRLARRRKELLHEGRWEEVTAEDARRLASWNPLDRVIRWSLAPGALEAEAAIHRVSVGQLDEGLVLARRAVQLSRRRWRIAGAALSAEGLAHLYLGHYAEAAGVAQRLRREVPSSNAADLLDLASAYHQGRFGEALSIGPRAIADPRNSVLRTTLSSILHLQGRDAEAFEILLDRPPDVRVFYTPQGLASLGRAAEGRANLETHQRLWVGMTEPLRFFQAARIYLDQDDDEGVRFTIEKAREVMGGHPFLQKMGHELEAWVQAARGNLEGAEQELRAARALLDRFPKRSSLLEFQLQAGRVYLKLGRSDRAVTALEEAFKAVLHPLDRHVAGFWLARAHEAAGNASRSRELDRAVSSDGIDTVLARRAREGASGG